MNFASIILQAAADSTKAAPKGGLFGDPTLFAIVGILVVMYFFMIRPQQKKQKELLKFKDTLEKGNKVVTIGGIHGTIQTVKEKTLIIMSGQTELEIEKSAVSAEMTRALNAPPVEPKPSKRK